MKCSATSFLILAFLLASCSLKTTKGLVKESSSIKEFTNNYFSNTQKDYVYKTKIDIYGNYFGGIMVFKKLKKSHHRIVFTTEFGAKIFDFEINNNTFKKNFIIDKLDKKLIVNTLKKDFKLLLQEKNKIDATFNEQHSVLYQSMFNKKYKFLKVNKANNQLEKIIYTTKHKEKVIISFSDIVKDIAKTITIHHKNIKLAIVLKSIN